MSVKLLLKNDVTRVEVVGYGHSFPLNFSIVAPYTESSFIEELIIQEFGTTRLDPNQLYSFLSNDSLVQSKFEGPELVSGSLSYDHKENQSSDFNSQALGKKLVLCGLLSDEDLDELLDRFQPYSNTQRFGEFLRLNLNIPFQILDFFLTKSLASLDFNSLRLGERLSNLGLVSQSSVDQALEHQRINGGRIGDILVTQNAINRQLTDFFARLELNEYGQFII
ncbi:hypothetical protein CBD41_04090 [bacterium TMED181]|nr:hypothetical protein [Planctomycetota bacterium]OUW45358.1 MAG: hypothetical protein CBD41_04090 [bacterium TMED181]